ncbi:MAG: MurR/RpiR family transcriptional regulator [Pseudomonadota bacterium]
MDSLPINDLIALHYETLSPQLKIAADHVVAHHDDVASRSLRSIAASSKLNPPTFSRLARALGLASYEEMRELCRNEIKYRSISFAEKAGALQSEIERDDGTDTQTPFALRQSASAIRNIDQFANELDVARLRAVADQLVACERVFLAGSLASIGFIQYFGYLATLAFDNWYIAGQNGISPATRLTGASSDDSVIVVMKNPYAKRSVDAAQMAHESGAFVVVITDSIACPAIRYATHYFIVPTDSPQFFSSYMATLLLLESLMGMVIRRSGQEVHKRLKDVETNNHRLGEYWQVTQSTSNRE